MIEHKCATCKRKKSRFTTVGFKKKADNCTIYSPAEWTENRRTVVFACSGYEKETEARK